MHESLGLPKHRMIPFRSGLQTSLPLPKSLQQFWDAFALSPPLPPQMLPGGLQDWPLVQTRLSLLLGSQYGV